MSDPTKPGAYERFMEDHGLTQEVVEAHLDKLYKKHGTSRDEVRAARAAEWEDMLGPRGGRLWTDRAPKRMYEREASEPISVELDGMGWDVKQIAPGCYAVIPHEGTLETMRTTVGSHMAKSYEAMALRAAFDLDEIPGGDWTVWTYHLPSYVGSGYTPLGPK